MRICRKIYFDIEFTFFLDDCYTINSKQKSIFIFRLTRSRSWCLTRISSESTSHDPELGCQVLTANLILNPSPLPPLSRCRKSEVFSPGWQGQVISLDWSRGGSNRRLFNLTVWSPGRHNIKYTDFKEIMLHSMEIFLLRN